MQQLIHYKRLLEEKNIELGNPKEQNTVEQQELIEIIQLLELGMRKRRRPLQFFMLGIMLTTAIYMIVSRIQYSADKTEHAEEYDAQLKLYNNEANRLRNESNANITLFTNEYNINFAQIIKQCNDTLIQLATQFTDMLKPLLAEYPTLFNITQTWTAIYNSLSYSWSCFPFPSGDGSASCSPYRLSRDFYTGECYDDGPGWLCLWPLFWPIMNDHDCSHAVQTLCDAQDRLTANSNAQENLRKEWSAEEETVKDEYHNKETNLTTTFNNTINNIINELNDELTKLLPHPTADSWIGSAKFLIAFIIVGEIIPAVALVLASTVLANAFDKCFNKTGPLCRGIFDLSRDQHTRVLNTAGKYGVNHDKLSYSQLREKFKIVLKNKEDRLELEQQPNELAPRSIPSHRRASST